MNPSKRARHAAAALAIESSPYLRGAKITVHGGMDEVAIYVDGKHGRQSLYLDRNQAAQLCFKLHSAVQDHLRANGGAKDDR